MRKVIFISEGFPKEDHLKMALNLAITNSGTMSIGEEREFEYMSYKTLLKIQESDSILVVLVEEEEE